ncbi:calcium-binding protein [Leptolyngbya ohadii]|uniref:calcium-binding protein n=1 Tax=Leptolyngbya ohadii TaxID=1962290 RepID=UPI000B5988E0|nr:calcium-binding protein [Leptolyngbya ohadii]
MTSSTQKQLNDILALLEENREIRPVRGRQFRGTRNDDVFFGRSGNVVANGRAGDDTLIGLRGIGRFSGGRGDDLLMSGDGADLLNGDGGADILAAGAGDDQLNGGNGTDFLDGGAGLDQLTGGNGNDQLVGGDGVDSLTGGADSDQFIYSGNLFANGTPALAGQTGIRVLNQPDVITDYTVGQDQFVFDRKDFGNANLVFQKGNAAQIGDGNVIVLQDAFAAAGAAARAIANNANVVADEGAFIYFNSTLGVNRLVYSSDLGDGGKISVLANLDNQRGPGGLTALSTYTAADFALG